eukprot:2415231-Lingulodinium_polyedra.AAC.1
MPPTFPESALNLNRVLDNAPAVTNEAYALPRGFAEEPCPRPLGACGAVSLDPGSPGPLGEQCPPLDPLVRGVRDKPCCSFFR